MNPFTALTKGLRRPADLRGWLRRQARAEGLWNLAVSLGFLLAGLLVLALVVLVCCYAVQLANARLRMMEPLSFERWPWSSLGLAGALTLSVLALLFAGNIRYVPQFLGRMPDRSVGTVGILLGIVFCGPWLVNAAWASGAKAWRLRRLNVPACAWILAILMQRGKRVSFIELASLVPGFNPVKVFPQLRDIDGVVFLTREPAGVSITDALRAELWDWFPEAPWVTVEDWQYRPFPQPDEAPQEERPAPPLMPPPEGTEEYQLLGLPHGASVAEVKAAYRRCVKECHPDRFATLGSELQQLAEERTKALNTAYATLLARLTDNTPDNLTAHRA